MPNDVVDGMQFAGGQDGLELKIGYVHRHVGIYPMIADPGKRCHFTFFRWEMGRVPASDSNTSAGKCYQTGNRFKD